MILIKGRLLFKVDVFKRPLEASIEIEARIHYFIEYCQCQNCQRYLYSTKTDFTFFGLTRVSHMMDGHQLRRLDAQRFTCRYVRPIMMPPYCT